MLRGYAASCVLSSNKDIGKVNQKVDPLPGALTTPTRPPCHAIIVLLIYNPSPSPIPEPVCTSTPCTRWKRSQMRSCSAGGNPGPSSCTDTRATGPTVSRETVTGLSTEEYLRALTR